MYYGKVVHEIFGTSFFHTDPDPMDKKKKKKKPFIMVLCFPSLNLWASMWTNELISTVGLISLVGRVEGSKIFTEVYFLV